MALCLLSEHLRNTLDSSNGGEHFFEMFSTVSMNNSATKAY